jgi:WD40 repeat protein
MRRSLWERVADRFGRLFGDDIFISHSHGDAREYAVALASRLGKHLETYVDRFSSRPGKDISAEVMDHLMRATMLVVVASPDSASSESLVGKEVEEFAGTGRQIIAVDVGCALQTCPWKHQVVGLSRPDEDPERLKSAKPSVHVRRSILRAFTYLTRAQMRRRVSAAIVLLTLIVTAILGGTAWRAALASGDAKAEQWMAESLERLAQKKEARAVAIMNEATTETERQRRLSAAQRIATVVEAAWQNESASVDDVLLAAAESLRRGPTPEAFRVISEALPLRATLQARYALDGIGAVVSPDQRWLAVFSEDEDFVFDLQRRRRQWSDIACEPSSVVFDPASRHVAFTCSDDVVRVIELATGSARMVRERAKDAIALFFLPNGAEALFTKSGVEGKVTITKGNRGEATFPARKIDVSPDFRWFALQTSEHDLELHSGHRYDGPPVAQFHVNGCIRHVVYSGEGSYLAVGASPCIADAAQPGSEVVVYRTYDGEVQGHSQTKQRLRALAVSQDGGEVAVITASGDVGQEGEIALLRLVQRGDKKYEPQWTRLLSWPDDEVVEPPLFLPREDRDPAQSALAYLEKDVLRVAGEGGREILRISNEISTFSLTKNRIVTVDQDGVSFWRMPAPPKARDFAAESKRSGRTAPPLWRASAAARKFLSLGDPALETVSDDGRYLLLAKYFMGSGNDVAVIDRAEDRIIDAFSESSLIHLSSPDGSRVAGVTSDYQVFVRDTRQHKTSPVSAQFIAPGVPPRQAAISSDGRLVAIGYGGTVGVRTLLDAGILWSLGTEGTLSAFRFDATGFRLAFVLDRLSVIVADVQSGKRVYQARMREPIRRVMFGKASTLVVEGEDGVARTISMDPIETALTVCRAVGAPIDRASWVRLVRDSYVDTCRELRRGSRAERSRTRLPD